MGKGSMKESQEVGDIRQAKTILNAIVAAHKAEW